MAPTALGKFIDDERAKKGWDQLTLAERSELPRSTISRIITGKVRVPDLPTLDRLANTLDVPFKTMIDLALLELRGKHVAGGHVTTDAEAAARLSVLVAAFPWLSQVADD